MPVLLAGSLNVTTLSGSGCFIALAVLMFRFAGLWTLDLVPRLATLTALVAIPLLLGQCLAFYVDIHMALVVCLSLYLLCLSLARGHTRHAYLGLAVALLAPSIKYSGLHFLPFLGALAAFAVVRCPPPRRPTLGVATGIGAALAFTSGWYVRNWLLRGNPIYPFAVPGWLRPVTALAGVPYEVDPEHLSLSPHTSFPHPLIPLRWLTNQHGPAMTADGFGTASITSLACVLVSLLLARRLPPARRRAWLSLWLLTAAVVATFPAGLSVPRYVLFVPGLASLGPAVLSSVARGKLARRGLACLYAGMLAFSGAYTWANIVVPGPAKTRIRTAWSRLRPYDPLGITRYPYVERGNLRIGYTSGFGNHIALLYDRELTNTLVPLHYRNYPYNYWHEFDSPAEFVEHVRTLDLDYIHVFDERYPGVALLRRHFPGKIRPAKRRRVFIGAGRSAHH